MGKRGRAGPSRDAEVQPACGLVKTLLLKGDPQQDGKSRQDARGNSRNHKLLTLVRLAAAHYVHPQVVGQRGGALGELARRAANSRAG